MRAWGIDESQLNAAASAVGVRVSQFRAAPGGSVRFVLRRDGAGSAYGRLTRDGRRTPGGAICWHGFRDFFRALFALAPEARVKTALADYRGREGFERDYRGTRGRYFRGGTMGPVSDCACPE